MLTGNSIIARRHTDGVPKKKEGLVDALGMLLKLTVTAGQSSNIEQADYLVIEAPYDYLVVDCGYNSDLFRSRLVGKSITPDIPGKKYCIIEIAYNKHIYK